MTLSDEFGGILVISCALIDMYFLL